MRVGFTALLLTSLALAACAPAAPPAATAPPTIAPATTPAQPSPSPAVKPAASPSPSVAASPSPAIKPAASPSPAAATGGQPSAAAAAGPAPSGSAAHGQEVYMSIGCHTCHGTVGQGASTGPRLAPNPQPYQAFAQQVRQPRQDMPRYAPQFLSDQDLADIYAYMQSIPPGPAATSIPLLNP